MRITKKLLRDARIRITQQVNDLFKLDQQRLVAFVESGMPGVKFDDSSREELLRIGVHQIVDGAIRQSWTD